MPTGHPPDRPQTLKQAKAAFKARGQPSVTTTASRQLARGAELLRRAERLKEQDRRKKDLSRKQSEKDLKDKQLNRAALLGTQVKLDRFGHKSSQFHLGAFVKIDTNSPTRPEQTKMSEPWETEDVDDESFLDIVTPPQDVVGIKTKHQSSIPAIAARRTPVKASAIATTDFLAGWEDFLDSSTQIARELTDEELMAPHHKPQASLESFSPDDDLFTDDDLLQLEVKSALPFMAERPKTADGVDKLLMPPPRLPVMPKPQKTARAAMHCPINHGITLAELEDLAADDILLTQLPDHG